MSDARPLEERNYETDGLTARFTVRFGLDIETILELTGNEAMSCLLFISYERLDSIITLIRFSRV